MTWVRGMIGSIAPAYSGSSVLMMGCYMKRGGSSDDREKGIMELCSDFVPTCNAICTYQSISALI